MVNWVYEQATGTLLYGGHYNPSCNPATQGIVSLSENPNPRLRRVDTATRLIRDATPDELTAYDAAELDTRMKSRFNGDKLAKALAIWCAQKFNVPLATAQQEIVAILKAL